jgi:hypothetical protein
MNLDRQIQLLIDNAPAEEGPRAAIAQAVAPVLKTLASRMKHLEYFLIRGSDRGWLLTTLSHHALTEVEKRVIYAFPTARDARNFPGASEQDMVVESLPVTHILFQMFALDRVDSVVFMETPGNLVEGTEIRRADLQKLVQQQLQKWQRSRNIPPDLA